MRMTFAAIWLLSALTLPQGLHAQDVKPDLAAEVAAVRAEVARSYAGLGSYTWIERTEVLVKGDVKSSDDLDCHFNDRGELVKTPLTEAKTKDDGNAVSKRPRQRKKADKNDYIERAISMIQEYVPPKPEQIDYLLRNGGASLGTSDTGASQVRLTGYFQTGDSMVFTYDPKSKVLLKVTVASTIGGPKDPVTLEANFQALPDGVNHLASATLKAKEKKVEIRRTNLDYKKVN